MINNSNTPYQVAFLGSPYTFNIPAGSRLAVAIAAGTYDILVYPAGSSAYVPHTISWDQLPPVVAPRTQFLNVRIEAASSNTLLIH
jgi:hypothetical protein